jgi:hypothetical protein
MYKALPWIQGGRVLMYGQIQNPAILRKDIIDPVTCMGICVNNDNPFDTKVFHQIFSADSHVTKHPKAFFSVSACMLYSSTDDKSFVIFSRKNKLSRVLPGSC